MYIHECFQGSIDTVCPAVPVNMRVITTAATILYFLLRIILLLTVVLNQILSYITEEFSLVWWGYVARHDLYIERYHAT